MRSRVQAMLGWVIGLILSLGTSRSNGGVCVVPYSPATRIGGANDCGVLDLGYVDVIGFFGRGPRTHRGCFGAAPFHA